MSLLDTFLNIGMKIPYICEEMRQIGARVDIKRAILHRRFINKRIEEGEAILSKIVGPLFNPNSPKQVAELLYKRWGLPEQYNTKKIGRGAVERKLTTDNEARKRLRRIIANAPDRYPRLAANFLDLQDYLEGERAKITFLDRISPDFRIHASFRSHGTIFYRLSSVPNFQNWPIYDVVKWGGARRDTDIEKAEIPVEERGTEGGLGSLRSNVIADDDSSLLVSTDFEQVEIWCYAVQTKCKWLLDIYDRGEYLYGVVYEDFFKQPFFTPGMPKKKKFKLPEMSEKYLRRAKAIPLGFLYGRSAAAVAEEHGWEIIEAEKYRKQWFRRCPELQISYDRDAYQVEQHGWIKYPFGHIIHFPSKKLTDIQACRGQNPAAGMLLTSMIMINDALNNERVGGATLKSLGNRIVLTVHDSITFNLNRTLIPQIYEGIIQPTLTRPVKELDGFRFRNSCEVGWRWDWETQDYNDWLTQEKAVVNAATGSALETDVVTESRRAGEDSHPIVGG